MEQQLVPYEAKMEIEGKRVLVLAPHPDDEVFGCGGAIMRHVKSGSTLQVVIVSDGEYRAESAQQSAYGELRRSESTKAAEILGYGTPVFWGIPDRGVEYGELLVQRIEQAINTLQADLVYAPSIYEMHPDHRALGMAALEAVRRNDNDLKLALYEVGVPMMRPNLLLDISALRDSKQQAMACFVSQLVEQPYDQQITALNRFRTYTLDVSITAAEAYLLADAATLKTDMLRLYESEYQRQRDMGLPMAPTDVPLVSVLIRSMNRHTLRRALDSVALQTYSHIEVVVVNAKGGVHDSLGDWCGRFPLRLTKNSEALQRSRAANFALKEAKGKYLIFLDDDDWFAPHHVDVLVSRIRQEHDVQAVHSNIQVVDGNGSFEQHVFKDAFDPLRMMADNLIPIHSVLFDNKLIGSGCGFDETFDAYEDWDFWLQVSRHTAFSHVDEVGAYYSASGNSEVGLQGIDDARKRARELVFEKWKGVWSGREINALLAYKDFVTATRAHEMEWNAHVLKEQTNSKIQALQEQLNTNARASEERLKQHAEVLSHEQAVSRSLNLRLCESESRTAELKRHIDELLTSSSWRVTRPLRWVGARVRNARHVLALGRQFANENGGGMKGAWRLCLTSTAALFRHGPFELADRIRTHASQSAVGPNQEGHTLNEEDRPSNAYRGAYNSGAIATTISPLKQSSIRILKDLFHKLPVSKETKNRIRDFSYQKFPILFRGLPSYKFWLTRGAIRASPFSGNCDSAAGPTDWSMMLPAIGMKTTRGTTPTGVIDIVIPVYRGLDQTRRCIDSVLNSAVVAPFRLILINDASPEIAVTEYLRSLRSIPRVTLIENPDNLGFTATVNLGMTLSSANDVVLLNSDTEVANDWLDRLASHAYSAARVGSVTPFSSNATICNYPTLDGMKKLPDEETTQSLDAAFASANSGRNIEIPTAVGFCMYIRRDCLVEVGLFDVETFGKGYGEENDFSLRASAMGWQHLLAADTFVFHEGEVSFQAGSNPRKERAMQILRGRYPYYERIVAEHVMQNEAHPLRVAATAARFKNTPLPVVLHILHAHGGGTEKHVEELCRRYLGKAKLLIMNAPIESTGDSRLRLRSAAPSDGLDLLLPASNVPFLVSLCQSFGISLIHIHHVLDYPFDLRILVESLSVPFYLTVHDYFLICPRINLMPPGQNYCGEPAPSKCNQCISTDAPHGGVDIIWWRANHAWLFEDASVVICPSHDVAMRCRGYFPDAAYRVVSHEEMPTHIFDSVEAPTLNKNEPLRVAILGVLARHKGLKLISEALIAANKACSPLEFRLVGFSEEVMPHVPSGLFTQTGPYEDAGLSKLIEEFDPHLILFPACWPETYSYTLTVALKSCRPIMATNIGAFPERVTSRPWTWLIDWNSSPSELVKKLEDIRSHNFQSRTPPPPPVSVFPLMPETPESGNFYGNEYLPVRGESRRLPEIIDMRTAGKITTMVLLENAGAQPSPCAYIRLILPLIQEHGDKLNLRWVTDRDFSHYKSDVLIIQRTAVTSISTINEIVAHCRENNIRIVYDLDDFLLALPDDHPEHAVYAPKSAAVSRWLADADEVWVSTEALRLRVVQINARAHVVPNHLDEQLWVKPVLAETQSGTDGIVRLLYMGTQTHLADFELVKKALHRIKKEFSTEIEIYLIGITANASGEKWYKTIVPPQTVGSSYPAFVNWIINGQDFDIGITPLVDNEFNRCKSAIKFLDYSALGMVTVASDLGVYKPIRHGENGFLVENSEDAWYQILKKLIGDPCLRSHVKRAAQSEVFESYGYESVRGLRTRLLAELLSESGVELRAASDLSGNPQPARLV